MKVHSFDHVNKIGIYAKPRIIIINKLIGFNYYMYFIKELSIAEDLSGTFLLFSEMYTFLQRNK